MVDERYEEHLRKMIDELEQENQQLKEDNGKNGIVIAQQDAIHKRIGLENQNLKAVIEEIKGFLECKNEFMDRDSISELKEILSKLDK